VSDRNGRLCALFEGLAARIHSADLGTLGFTGAVFGEGASTLALGTSVSLAALDPGPVLLVDANWLRPSLTSDAGVASGPGLADVLRGDADLDEAVVATGRPRLSFLAAGVVNGKPPPLGRLAPFLDQARSQFSTVVADLPPALAGDDVVVPWANALEQLFVVVRSGVTPLNIVRRALEQVALERPQVVLNGLSTHTAATTALPPAAAT
jgi:Mrp family chromosome partitioning ATPase